MKEWGDEKLNSRKGVVVVVLWWLALVDFRSGLFCKGGWNWGTCRRESLESRKKKGSVPLCQPIKRKGNTQLLSTGCLTVLRNEDNENQGFKNWFWMLRAFFTKTTTCTDETHVSVRLRSFSRHGYNHSEWSTYNCE